MTIWRFPLWFGINPSLTPKTKQSNKNPSPPPPPQEFPSEKSRPLVVVVPGQTCFSGTSNRPNDTARNEMQKCARDGQIPAMVVSWTLEDWSAYFPHIKPEREQAIGSGTPDLEGFSFWEGCRDHRILPGGSVGNQGGTEKLCLLTPPTIHHVITFPQLACSFGGKLTLAKSYLVLGVWHAP